MENITVGCLVRLKGSFINDNEGAMSLLEGVVETKDAALDAVFIVKGFTAANSCVTLLRKGVYVILPTSAVKPVTDKWIAKRKAALSKGTSPSPVSGVEVVDKAKGVSGEVPAKQTPTIPLYAVVEEATLKVFGMSTDRDKARLRKARLGGKSEGFVIYKLKVEKEIR